MIGAATRLAYAALRLVQGFFSAILTVGPACGDDAPCGDASDPTRGDRSRPVGANVVVLERERVRRKRFDQVDTEEDARGHENRWYQCVRTYDRAVAQALSGQAVRFVAPSLMYHSMTQLAADAALLGDMSAFVDIGNLHNYPAGGLPSAALDRIPAAQTIAGTTHPLQATETGYHTCVSAECDHPGGISEQAQGKYIPRLLFVEARGGVRRTYLSTWNHDTNRNLPNDDVSVELDFGRRVVAMGRYLPSAGKDRIGGLVHTSKTTVSVPDEVVLLDLQ